MIKIITLCHGRFLLLSSDSLYMITLLIVRMNLGVYDTNSHFDPDKGWKESHSTLVCSTYHGKFPITNFPITPPTTETFPLLTSLLKRSLRRGCWSLGELKDCYIDSSQL